MVFNGKPTREQLSREDTSSPTTSLEAIFKTVTIYAYEWKYIMVLDVLNTFIQAKIPPNKYGEGKLTMKITGVLVDMLL